MLKRRIALWLRNAPRGRMNDTAEMLGVSTRTLRNWKKTECAAKKMGRPRVENTLGDLIAIGREWKHQGYKGSRPVIEALPWLRVRLVREVIAGLKARRVKRRNIVILNNRISVKGLSSGALHVLDATELERKNILLVGKDRASCLLKVNKLGARFRDDETIRYLEELKACGRLPLVLATDNGSQFCSGKVRCYLEKEKIIHLKSQPHTPEHNGACEVAIRELKETLLETRDLDVAVNNLNYGLKRRQLNYKTAADVDEVKKLHYTEAQRLTFYRTVQKLVCTRKIGLKNAREIRKAEREAILETLERFKLIKLTRGDQKLISEWENIT